MWFSPPGNRQGLCTSSSPNSTKRVAMLSIFMLGIGTFVTVSSASAVLFEGHILDEKDSSGIAAVIHSATGNATTPPGGFEQHAGGKVFWEIDNALFRFNYEDKGAAGFGEGDEISWAQQTYSIYKWDTVVNDDDDLLVGMLTLKPGSFVIGGTSNVPNQYTNLISGSFGYQIDITTYHKVNKGEFFVGDIFEGVITVQAYAYTNKFSGAKELPPDGIKFSLWGSSEGPGDDSGTLTRQGQESAYTIGFDLLMDGTVVPVPEPGSVAAVAAIGLLGVTGYLWRRRERSSVR